MTPVTELYTIPTKFATTVRRLDVWGSVPHPGDSDNPYLKRILNHSETRWDHRDLGRS
jgi:hypothetical protein